MIEFKHELMEVNILAPTMTQDLWNMAVSPLVITYELESNPAYYLRLAWKKKFAEIEKMKKLKIEDPQDACIFMDGKRVGRVFTPAGSSCNRNDAIQVCGFDEAYTYWGCARYIGGHELYKKDIQLLFGKDSRYTDKTPNIWEGNCGQCFHPKEHCNCKDLVLRKDYKDAKKHQSLQWEMVVAEEL